MKDYTSFSTIKDDTPAEQDGPTAQFVKKKPSGLKGIFGKAAALASLAGTLLFYTMAFNISAGYYHRWEDSKTGVSQKWDYKDPTENLPWLPAGGALALSFGAGAAGIAAGRSRRKQLKEYYASTYPDGPTSYYNSYGSNDNWFFWYWLGRNSGGGGSSSPSSSSSDDNSGLAFLFVAGAALALAASATVVTYEAIHKNFGEQGIKPKIKPGPATFSP